ncbi:unnamed protein product [Triticum turgidum subsp. durum]|uniref:SFR19-like C-terminal domain-containing protein n=1 Tax=Triticum turgidum subsp. durum TaxID=4567 RepID=A0A9R0R4H1_TRITD|nr:unnamed protein product [Triticum turgidum subsp. durum]
MATAAGPVGGLSAKDEIREVEMEIMNPPEEAAERAGLKRAWGSASAGASHGFIGVTTAEKKPTLLPRNNVKYLKKTGSGNLLRSDMPDTNAWRFSSSSPGGDLGSKTRTPTSTFNAQGKNCTSPHEREGSGFGNLWSQEENAGSLTSVGYGKHRGSEEGFEAQCVSNLNDLHNYGRYRTLIHSYGEDNRGLAHNSPNLNISERSCRTDNLWTTKPTPPVNELVQISVQGKNHKPSLMGRHISLPSDSYLDGRGTLSRLHLDGENLLPDLNVAKASSLSDSHVSDYWHRPFDSSVSFDYPQYDVYFDKGCGTSRLGLRASSSCQPEHLSPIKDDPWVTSVPFVPLVEFPNSTSPSNSPYDPLADSMDPPKVESGNILKSSNISCSISSQHTAGNGVIYGDINKSLIYADKLARNMSAKGSNEFAGLVAPVKERSSLDVDTLVKAFERTKDGAIDEKTRDYFRIHLAEHVKELLKPIWKEGKLSKDAHKLIVKKSVDKVLASVDLHQVPATKELITDYITMSGTKIEKLVKVKNLSMQFNDSNVARPDLQ